MPVPTLTRPVFVGLLVGVLFGCGSEAGRASTRAAEPAVETPAAQSSRERERADEITAFVVLGEHACTPSALDAPGPLAPERDVFPVSVIRCEPGVSGAWWSASVGREIWASGEAVASCARCSYDASERVQRCRTSGRGDSVWTYDEAGSVIRSARDGDLDGVFERITVFGIERDGAGRVTRQTLDDGADGTLEAVRTIERPAPGVEIELVDDDADGAIDTTTRIETAASGVVVRHESRRADDLTIRTETDATGIRLHHRHERAGECVQEETCQVTGSTLVCERDDNGDGVIDLRTRTTTGEGRTVVETDTDVDGVIDQRVVVRGDVRETWEYIEATDSGGRGGPRGRRGREPAAVTSDGPRLVRRDVTVDGRRLTYDADGVLSAASWDELNCDVQ